MPSTSRTASAAKPKRKAAKTVAKRAAKVTSASAEHSGSVTPEPRWRSRASDRATRALRARADERNERFLAAALELLSKGESDLSVRDVVELSQMSLRSFYEYEKAYSPMNARPGPSLRLTTKNGGAVGFTRPSRARAHHEARPSGSVVSNMMFSVLSAMTHR